MRRARLHETEVGDRVRNVGDAVVGDEVDVSFGKHAQSKYVERGPDPHTWFSEHPHVVALPKTLHPDAAEDEYDVHESDAPNK